VGVLTRGLFALLESHGAAALEAAIAAALAEDAAHLGVCAPSSIATPTRAASGLMPGALRTAAGLTR
jgi:hypothetical protein